MRDGEDVAVAAPTIESERLVLRAHRLDDFPDYAAMYADARFVRFLDEGAPLSEERAWPKFLRFPGGWRFQGFGLWAIEERASRHFIGNVGFSTHRRAAAPLLDDIPEIGWSLAPLAQGKGYAVEAAQRALAWIDSRGRWGRTACVIEDGNERSVRVAERCGFRQALFMMHCNRHMRVFFREAISDLDTRLV